MTSYATTTQMPAVQSFGYAPAYGYGGYGGFPQQQRRGCCDNSNQNQFDAYNQYGYGQAYGYGGFPQQQRRGCCDNTNQNQFQQQAYNPYGYGAFPQQKRRGCC